MDDYWDQPVTRKDLDAMQAKWDSERKQRMLKAEKQFEREAKQAIREKFRSRTVIKESEEPLLDPDEIYSAGEPLNPINSDDLPLQVTGRKHRRKTKTESTLTPELLDPDFSPEAVEIENLGRFVISTGEDESSNSWATTYGG